MTRQEIKMMMINSINDALETELEERNIIDERINEDVIHDYLWNRDFGIQLINDYIEEHEEDIIEAYLDEIFEEIDTEDLDMPW